MSRGGILCTYPAIGNSLLVSASSEPPAKSPQAIFEGFNRYLNSLNHGILFRLSSDMLKHKLILSKERSYPS